MQLDRTRIAIRQRNFTEVLDLALHVFRIHARPLLLYSAALFLPLMLVNHLLIGWMADVDYREQLPVRFIWHLGWLVFLESQLAGFLATLYLGQAMFLEQPSLSRIARDARDSLFPLAWAQLIVRGILPAWALYLLIPRHQEAETAQELLLLTFLFFGVAFLRSLRPFMSEIVLLERNPLFSRDKGTITVGRRSSHLHGASAGDLFGRSIYAGLIAVLMVMAVYSGFAFISGMLFNNWEMRPLMIEIVLPLSMWLVATFFHVVRFLNYLDTRIRFEGWEVELRMRAEAARLLERAAL